MAKTVTTEATCSAGSVALILKRLYKPYAIEKINKLDKDLAEFLDYS